MPKTPVNGIEIYHETDGDRAARPLLLLRGLGTQLSHWAPELRSRLADAGHFLVVFDNRDVGLSTHLADGPQYAVDDMADDVVGLMDALSLETAHVAGISMGGMISQVVAARHPRRVRSLVSIMASTGNAAVPGPTPAALEALMAPTPTERAAYIEHTVRGARVFGSPGYPTPDDVLRQVAGRAFDRAFDPAGVARQFTAIQTSGDRREALAGVTAPTLVIHGDDDPLVSPEGGRDTARAIPGAELRMIPGMGHDVPPGLWDTLVSAIAEHTAKAES
jgi:pimeloyl-ACP methyl ester carboxylesterase